MGEKVSEHIMRIYAIMFFGFGLICLIVPNFVMDILSLPHIDGYFWGINMFAYLVLLTVISIMASKNQELIKFITFVKFFSASTFLIFSAVFLSLGLLISGLVDFGLGIGIILGKKI
jgi:hypothetical protein